MRSSMPTFRLSLTSNDLPVLLDRRRASTRTESIRDQGPLALAQFRNRFPQSIFFVLRPARRRSTLGLLTILLPDGQQRVGVLRLVLLGNGGAVALALPGHDLPVLFHARGGPATSKLLRDLLPGAFGTVLPDLRGAYGLEIV